MNFQCFNPQFYIASQVGDAAIQADSKGRGRRYNDHLRILIDAVRVLCAVIPTDHLLPGDRQALERFAALGQPQDSIAAPGESSDGALTAADVDDLIRRLKELRQHDPRSADEIVRRVIEEVGRPDENVPS